MQNKEKSKWTEQTKKKQQQERQQNKENMAKQKKEKIEIPWGVEEEEEEEKGEKKEAMEEEEKKKKREKKEEKTKKEEEEEEEEQQQEIELNFGDAIELFNEQKNKKGIKSVEEVDKIDIPLNIFGETATIIPTVDIEWGEDIEVIEVEEEEEEEEEEELKIPFYYPLLNKIPWVNNWFPKEPTKEQMIGHRIKVSLFNIGHFILWFFWAFFHTIYFHDTKAEGFMYRHKVLNRSLSGLAQCTVAFILFYSVLAGFMFTNLLLLSYGLYGNPQFNLINYSNSY